MLMAGSICAIFLPRSKIILMATSPTTVCCEKEDFLSWCPVLLKGLRPINSSILFFDGDCGLCQSTVRFLLKRDKRRKLKFSPLQGSTAQKVLDKKWRVDLSTVVFYDKGVVYTQSTAALRALSFLGGVYFLLSCTLLFLPLFLRDRAYQFIAARRASWKQPEECFYLSQERREESFLD